MNTIKTLWADEAGYIISTELMLAASLLVFGVVVGLSELRDSVNAELNDMSSGIRSINQSFAISGVSSNGSSVAGSHFTDPNSGAGGVSTTGNINIGAAAGNLQGAMNSLPTQTGT